MKKALLSLMATAICGLVLTGCAKSSDPYVPPGPDPGPTPTPTPEEQYDEAFLKYVGGTISPQQDWGFSTTASVPASTRAENEGEYVLPENVFKYFTQAFYKQVLDSLPEKGDTIQDAEGKRIGIKHFEFESKGLIRFEINYSYTDSEDLEIGYYYYNPKTETVDNRKEVVLVSALAKDQKENKYFQYTKSTSTTIPENQWYTPEIYYGYGIWEDYKAQKVRGRTFTVYLSEGYRMGFYVKNPHDNNGKGEKVYSNRFLNKDEQFFFAALDSKEGSIKNAYVVGMEDHSSADAKWKTSSGKDRLIDFDCNDVLIAVQKKMENTDPELYIPERDKGRIIAEDLSASESTDFDFNDVVLDVWLTATGADCKLMAAGGQLPIRINKQDDLEVHKLFGVDLKTMVNTNAEKKGLPGAKIEPVSFSIKGKFKSVDDIIIEVKKEDGKWHELYADKGKPACKMKVKIGFLWPDEQESLKVKYDKFVDWVKDPSVVWY